MASKDKLLANAQKFLSKGQTKKAIGEYQKLVDSFPKDVRNRQKFAELLSRDKRKEDALTEYEVVAKHYTDTGFYLKAIAVFKQMQKIESSRADIYHRLAELNEKQGLVGNALTEYRNLVAFYDKNRMHSEAIEVLEKMAELDPGNLNVLAKVAEFYKVTGQNDLALEKFNELVAQLSAGKQYVKIIKLYDCFLDICPEDSASRLPLAAALVGNGSADKAISILKELLKQSPENQEINRCLAEAYVVNRDFANARLTLKHLLKVNEGDLDLREYYVRVCLDFGEFERARDRLESWKDAFLQAGRAAILKDFYEELQESLADDAVVADTLAAIYETDGVRSKPGETDTSACSTAVEETAEDAVVETAVDDLDILDLLGEKAATDDGAPAEELPPEKVAAADVLLDLDLEAPVAGDQDAAELAAEPPRVEAENVSAAEEDVDFEDIELEVDIDLDDIEELALDFDDDFTADGPAAVAPQEAAPEEDLEDEDELAIDAGLYLDVDDTDNSLGAVAAEPDDLVEPQLLEELEELEALEELEDLEDLEKPEFLDEAAPAAAAAIGGRSDLDDSVNLEAELDEVEYFLQQGLYDDAEAVVQSLMKHHPDLPELHAKMEQISRGRLDSAAAVESSDFVDLMAELRDDDLLATTDFLDSFDAETPVDEELAQKTVSELDSADTESHFNLGIAYKEMGLYDDAIAEFEKASKDPSRAVDCITLTGQCQSESGATDLALETFKQGLAMQNLNDESRMGLNFELGMLYQMNGQLLEALEAFQLVAEKDSFFRNVSDLIKSLRRELGLGDSDDDGPQGDRDRVSYV